MDENILRAMVAQEEPPPPADAPTFGKVVDAPGGLALLGLILFGALYLRSLSSGRNMPLRHLGTVLILAALVLSGLNFLQLTNKETGDLYRAAIVSQYTLIAHYAVPAVLLLVLIAIGAAELHLNKKLSGRSS